MKKVLKNSFLMGRKRFRRKSDDNKSNVNKNGNKFDTNSINNAAGTLLELANGKLTDSSHDNTTVCTFFFKNNFLISLYLKNFL